MSDLGEMPGTGEPSDPREPAVPALQLTSSAPGPRTRIIARLHTLLGRAGQGGRVSALMALAAVAVIAAAIYGVVRVSTRTHTGSDVALAANPAAGGAAADRAHGAAAGRLDAAAGRRAGAAGGRGGRAGGRAGTGHARSGSAAGSHTSGITPPAYLMAYYRKLSHTDDVPWQVLAALSYKRGGYSHVLTDAHLAAVQSAARDDVGAGAGHTSSGAIAHAAAADSRPVGGLAGEAQALAQAGAANSPGKALASYTGSSAQANAVLTLAQEIGEAGVNRGSSAKRKLQSMLTEARLLNGLPYVWGGGHETPAWIVQGGFDCSGFVSEVLHAAGYLDGPDTTQTLPGEPGILKGPGRYVTIYDRTINTAARARARAAAKAAAAARAAGLATPQQQTDGVHLVGGRHPVNIRLGAAQLRAIAATQAQKGNELDNAINDEHVIIDLDGQWWESGGDAKDGGGEMVHRMTRVSRSYIKSFNLVLHPAGM